MARKTTLAVIATVSGVLLLALFAQKRALAQDMKFGGSEDVAFANKLWKAMDGYQDWRLTTAVYDGQSPHGKFLRLYSTYVTVDSKSYPIIVKDNFGGRGATKKRVERDPADYLKAITIMLEREEGYDPGNDNWYWVKYGPDGTILKNEPGMLLAGRVAKGMKKGCISCHVNAEGNDYLYSNDE